MTGSLSSHSRRFVAIADSDSYVKWAASLLGGVHCAHVRVLLVRTPLTVSAEQERAALVGSGLSSHDIERVHYNDLVHRLEALQPDAVFVAGRGPFVRIAMHQIDAMATRPVVVTGLPGMSIPAQRGAVHYRRRADLFLVHSRRERRAFSDLAAHMAVPMRFGLASLPYALPHHNLAREGTDIVFAAQAIVPRERAERLRLADILRRTALAHPDRRIVIKLRSRAEAGELETHHDEASFPDLFAELGGRPANVVYSHASMAHALASAEGLVTVSSTAAIEAIAMGVPVLALDTFGVSKPLLNTVFTDSGLFGDEDDLLLLRFRHPSPEWAERNYFHDESKSTWLDEVDYLVAERQAGRLPVPPAVKAVGGSMRLAWERKSMLGSLDRSATGALALAIGMPARAALLAMRRSTGTPGPFSWHEPESDITVTPAPTQEPLIRERPKLRQSAAV
jgi:hypothetical protein